MIKKIQVFSRRAMEDTADQRRPFFPYWYLISIYGDDKVFATDGRIPVLASMGCKNVCSLDFWDITDKDYSEVKRFYSEVTLFSENQAKQVIDFLDLAQKDPEDSVLVVHCTAGISRSGAVATFACDYCGLSYNEFMKANPFIYANPFVLRTLRRVANKDFNDFHNGQSHEYLI